MIKSFNILSSIFVLAVLLLPFLVLPISAYRSYFSDDDYKYARPCTNNTFDEFTGNFKCMVETADECFQLCQKEGCFEWSIISFMASTDRRIRDNYRCRCFPSTSMCFYTHIPYWNRGYE